MQQPLVSIIIPTYNRSKTICETLDSVISQTYSNWECIIIDDGSSDNTKELVDVYLEKDNRFKFYNRPDNYAPGGNGARNFGLEMSNGSYINWLDSDDIFHHQKLEKQLNLMKKEQAVVCVSLGEYFNENIGDDEANLWSEWNVSDIGVFDSLITQKMRWPTGAVLWKRDVLTPNCWHKSIKGGQEWLFHNLMALQIDDSKIQVEENVLLYIRNNNSSITRENTRSKRYSNYLKARVYLLDFLYNNYIEYFNTYFTYTYNFSLRYVKQLIIFNKYKSVFELSNLICKMSFLKCLYFTLGIVVFKVTGKDLFLKKVNTI